MKDTMFFKHIANYLDHEGMMKMIESDQGENLKSLASQISVCLHEDWKNNLIREKGEEYQHFRPVKDAEMEKEILENAEKYLSIKSKDGKPLYRIDEKVNADGSVTKSAQFDLIRVPFENLSKKWQNANYDAAQFALCLVKTSIDKNAFEGDPEQIFKNFEKMAHDVHIEWMERESDWADVRLLVPYEQLVVKTAGHNEKDKDRAHVQAIVTELTFQPNILARNRSIVARAIKELTGKNATESGLNPEFSSKLSEINGLLETQNNADYARYTNFKNQVKTKIEPLLEGKTSLSLADVEKMAEVYYNCWKKQAKTVGKLPKEYDASYSDLLVDDERINFKNVARREIADLIKEMAKEKTINESLIADADTILNEDTSKKLGQKIKERNQEDLANYQALTSGAFGE